MFNILITQEIHIINSIQVIQEKFIQNVDFYNGALYNKSVERENYKIQHYFLVFY